MNAPKQLRRLADVGIIDDPLWFKDAIIYELHIKSFADSNGDGIGDFRGLSTKLDYLQDLGINAIWLLPFYPSPLRDDGYDTADYTDVHPAYGTLRDFKRFLKEAHARSIRVITELVINHTSSDHPWFRRARKAPKGSKWRNFYVWSDSAEEYLDARIIFGDFETSNWTWDPVAQAYYWHRFYSHQPDLNFDNPDVHKAVFKALDFWMDLGVDGMRLDAIPYLYEREGTNCENLPETHEFLRKLRSHIDSKYKNRMFLAEANQWPEDAAQYFGEGDECHMNFHFPLMPRMFMAVHLENHLPILDILEQTPEIPENCQWALFLRNHDELTLEMVTDEDRDFMYRVYASDPQARINLGIRRRLAPLLKLRRKIELMNGLLFSLPGTPVIYYGDEIGMGDNFHLGDRDGVRTPMQWSYDRNAGFSRANPQRLYLPLVIDPEYHYESVNVEAQQNNPTSLLWWMKRLIALRKQHSVFGRGDTRFLRPDNHKVLAYVRTYGADRVLVVANLARFAQAVELDLSEYAGLVPVEMFGRSHFPGIGEQPYFLSLGPHEFFWFSLESPETGPPEDQYEPPTLEVAEPWPALLAEPRHRAQLARALPTYLRGRRWFRGKARQLTEALIIDTVPLTERKDAARMVFVRVDYRDAAPEIYVMVLAYAAAEPALEIERTHPEAVLARTVPGSDGRGVLYDALVSPAHAASLLRLYNRRRPRTGEHGAIAAYGFGSHRRLVTHDLLAEPKARVLTAEQTNTSILFADKLILKLARQIEPGQNPDIEIGRYLTEREFEHVPELVGSLDYEYDGTTYPIGMLQEFVPNLGDAWKFTRDSLEQFFERVLSLPAESTEPELGPVSIMERIEMTPPPVIEQNTGGFLAMAELLGERTAELHLCLAAEQERPDFKPQSFSTLHQRSLYQAARTTLVSGFELLRKQKRKLPEELRPVADELMAERHFLDTQLKRICGAKLETVRIRTHGDFHLGQVLYTGSDFVIIDFEGEPARPIGERRIKRAPLRDVAGMLRSFHYAAAVAVREWPRIEDADRLDRWSGAWRSWVSASYLRAYLAKLEGSRLVPETREAQRRLLRFFIIEKCAYELSYELNNRPSWVWIPARGLLEIARSAKPASSS